MLIKILLRRLVSAVLISSSMLMLYGCREDRMPNPDETVTPSLIANTDSKDMGRGVGMPGVMYIKVDENVADQIKIDRHSGLAMMNTMPSAMSVAFNAIGAYKTERLFPYAGKFEERTRKKGLHRWLIVHFDEKISLDQAISQVHQLKEVNFTEKVYETFLYDKQSPIIDNTPIIASANTIDDAKKELPYNDPRLIEQWHYKNFGLFARSVEGADINLLEAWKKTTGTRNVIVNVVDGFLDAEHEDLKENMWVNEKEIPGNNIDDDNNGYIDDINGYNFVQNYGKLEPDDASHGTHVAGTVAARNNNGIGVCGVAGGNGEPNTGIRLMSSQMFRFEKEQGNSAAALKYGADNGAVISQNSWGYTYPGPGYMPRSIADAIDYFIEFAGCDNNGNQLEGSPMKGGVVIFAAGNDNRDYESYPAAYKPVVSVSAMAPDWKKAWYTNRGDWITVMAPGGDEYYAKGMVLSTLSPKCKGKDGQKYEKYGYMQGTSMACPHVSGIAALIVSYYGGKGFTNEMCKQKLITAFRPEQNIDKNNPGYEGRLGAGYIDADQVFAKDGKKTPKAVTQVNSTPDFTFIDLSWSAVTDEDDGTAAYYQLYYSENPITEATLDKAGVKSLRINGVGLAAGATVKTKIQDLKTATKYNFLIQSVDRWGNKSKFYAFNATTKTNNPPVLSGLPTQPILVSVVKDEKFTVKVHEPEGQSWSYDVSGENRGVSVNKTDAGVDFIIRAIAPVGKYNIKLKVYDELGLEVVKDIPFEVYEYVSPKQLAPIQSMIIGLNEGNREFDLGKYIQVDKYAKISYELVSSNEQVVKGSVADQKLTLKPLKEGVSTLRLKVNDGFSQSLEARFEVRVVSDTNIPVYLVYPMPVTKDLHVVVNPSMKQALFSIRTVRGEEVYHKNRKIGETGLIKINVSNLSAGGYTLIVTGDKGSYKKAFVKL